MGTSIFAPGEIYKEVEGFSNYLITSHGIVYNNIYGKFLKPDIMEKGYKRFSLYKNNSKYRFFAHRMVALHFIDNPLNKPEVNHIDHDPSNNSLDNLEWVTRKENQDRSNARYVTRTQGELSNLSILTEDRVDAIRCLLKNGFSVHKISRIFNISRSGISKINNRKTWRFYNVESK